MGLQFRSKTKQLGTKPEKNILLPQIREIWSTKDH